MRVVTWNVWFGEWERERRWQALWATIATRRPDVICLQEVMPEHLDGPELRRLRDAGWWVSDEHLLHYDALLLTQLPVAEHERLSLPSVMGRRLVLARLATTPAITIATVHLESTDRMTAPRCRQLADIHARLAREPNDVLLVGDMNFPAGDRPEAAQLPDWRDVWADLHPGDPGYTVDSKKNFMRALMKPGTKQARIDRVFHRGGLWRPTEILRLGTRSLPGDPTLYISDHFGLEVDLTPT